MSELVIFVSHATVNLDRFHIKDIAEELNKKDRIFNVLYWEEHMHNDIFKFMNDNVKQCDVFLLFCSPEALASDSVGVEWRAAMALRKHIIPIFEDKEYIPALLSSKLGVQFDKFNLRKTIDDIYHMILKRTSEEIKFPPKKAPQTKKILDPALYFQSLVDTLNFLIKIKQTNELMISDIAERMDLDIISVEILLGEFIFVNRIRGRIEDRKTQQKDDDFLILEEQWNGDEIAQERLNKERLDKEILDKEKFEKKRSERERLEHEKLEKERLANQQLAKERLEQKQMEKDKLHLMNEIQNLYQDQSLLEIKPLLTQLLSNKSLTSNEKGQWAQFSEKIEKDIEMLIIEDYYGTSLIKRDIEVLKLLENNPKFQIPFKFKFDSEKKTIIELNLLRKEISTLPENIGQLKDLLYLELSWNHLESLPESIGQLTKLETLNVTGNRLTTLPNSFFQLKNLQRLDLDVNQLTTIPEELNQLINLKCLRLSENKLQSLPQGIGQLKKLKELNLKCNLLTTLPTSFTQLTNLEELDLTDNKHLTNFQETLFNLTCLKRLELRMIYFNSLSENISKLTNLQRLDLSWNRLSTLPKSFSKLKNLRSCDVSFNGLIKLPIDIKMLVNLRYFNIENNPISKDSKIVESIQSIIKNNQK